MSTTPRRIILTHEDDGGWIAIDERTGMSGRGHTRELALEELDETVVHYGDVAIVKTPEVLHGVPRIDGTRVGVRMIGDMIRRGEWTVDGVIDELQLTPAEVEAALDYYADHPDEMDTLREEDDEVVRRIREQNHPPQS